MNTEESITTNDSVARACATVAAAALLCAAACGDERDAGDTLDPGESGTGELTLCVATSREKSQIQMEMPQFLAHARSQPWGKNLRLSCRHMPNYAALADSFVNVGDGEVLRQSSAVLDDTLRANYPYIDIVWGYGINYILELDQNHPDMFRPYLPEHMGDVWAAIQERESQAPGIGRWFVNDRYYECRAGGGSDDMCEPPLYVGITAYLNVACTNPKVLHELLTDEEGVVTPLDWSSWTSVLTDPRLKGKIRLPRIDTAGTGVIFFYALAQELGSPAAAMDLLEELAHSGQIRFTYSGTDPCTDAADADIAVGISHDVALRNEVEGSVDDGTTLSVFPAFPLARAAGFEVEAVVLVRRTDGTDAEVDPTLAKRFYDWAVGPTAMDYYMSGSSMVAYPADSISSGVCDPDSCPQRCVALDYRSIPNDKLKWQSAFTTRICQDTGAPVPPCLDKR